MAKGYTSTRSVVAETALVASSALILGPSRIGENTIVDHNTIIGYPRRYSLRRVLENREARSIDFYLVLDEASSGARIGGYCHIRPGTVVYENVVIGNHVETGHNVLVREDTVIGGHTIIGTATVIDGRARIGSNVRIETGVYIPPETIIEDNVFLGPHAVITNDRYPPSSKLRGAVIRRGAVIGANAVLVAGIEIGENAVIGAGSIVTKDVPSEIVVVGSPAKPIMSRKDYEERKKMWAGRH